MRTLYHEFESLEHLMSTRLLPGGGDRPIRMVIFGGTGAVGGAVVLELCRRILASGRSRDRAFTGEIWATGTSDKDISKFVGRLYLAHEKGAGIEKIEPLRHYRIGGSIDLRFSILHLALPRDLPQTMEAARREAGEGFDLEASLAAYFDSQPRPFLEFVEGLGEELLNAVIVAIPLPSVATYTLGILDRLTEEAGLDHRCQQRIKGGYLRSFIRGLAVVQQRYARHVLMAHTTAVGGMYRVDGGDAEIRLGFAHSALGKKLVDKKYFADELTQLYCDHGFDVLITAAAIGIDAVEFHCRLPSDRAARAALTRRAADLETGPVVAADLEAEEILLYPAWRLDLEPPETAQPICFGEGKELIVDAAVRSGENGMFSVANCVALYSVMKVAIPEELALVLVRRALFGPERRRDWFEDQVCYYSETECSYFALRLLESYPELVRAHYGAFSLQAYQALGSSTHQARLHELGLLLLLLRLRNLATTFPTIPEETLAEAVTDLEGFFWKATRRPCFEDLEELDAERIAHLLGELCEIDSMDDAGRFLGYDPRRHARRQRGREKFLHRLATHVRRVLDSITSLGIPVIYRGPADGRDRILVGPYVAPLELAVGSTADLHRAWRSAAETHGVPYEVARDWVIVNNGFVDLRPSALGSAAKEPGPQLADEIRRFASADEVAVWISSLPVGSYFTTCGVVALKLRLSRLFGRIRNRRIELGTHETWKHLFPQDAEGRYVLSPGLVETVRMYSEGLGKVTGTEALWPEWGY